MIKLVFDNYRTYVDTAQRRPEKHLFRLIAFAGISLVFAVFSGSQNLGVHSIMATGITVLTGFTFTALFSDHALASSGLPHPKDENARQDLVRLNILSENFRIRSSYFITISILDVVFLAAASSEFYVPDTLGSWLLGVECVRSAFNQPWFFLTESVAPIMLVAFALIINFIYLECLYTFFRLAETILAILDIRRDYLGTGNEDEAHR